MALGVSESIETVISGIIGLVDVVSPIEVTN
jgi:hypothetical protein